MILAAIACTFAIQADVLVIARDGSTDLSKLEREALAKPNSASIDALRTDGYIIAEIESNVLLAIDPSSPPLRQIAGERLLLEVFASGTGPTTFSQMNKPTQRIIGQIVGSIMTDREPDDDSQFLIRAEARFNLTFPGRTKNYVTTYLLNGPTHEQLQALGKRPLKAKEPDPLAAPTVGDTLSLTDNFLPGADLKWRVDTLEKCQQRIVEQLKVEIEARDAAMRKALDKLANAPNLGSGKEDIPAERLDEMRRNFLGSWRSQGFGSEAEAAAAWDGATWSRGGVAFTLHFGDSFTHGGAPVIGGYQFAFSGR